MPVLAACILSFSVAASATAPAFVSADVWIPPSSRLLAVTLSAALGISLLFVVFAAFLALRLGGPMAGLNQSRPPHDGSRVKGFVAPGFEEARNVLESLVDSGMEDNVQACAYMDGKLVLDIVGCHDVKSSRHYGHASVQNVFSSTKAVTSLVMAMLVDRGHIKYDTAISTLWPEFAQYDKEDITLSDVLRHESGLHEFDFALTGEELHREKIKDSASVVRHKIASAKKRRHAYSGSRKGSHHAHSSGRHSKEHKHHAQNINHDVSSSGKSRAYHAITRGWILNEICLRADPQKRTIGEFIRDEIARPLGISKELTLGTETIALLDSNRDHSLGSDRGVVPLKHTPIIWLILELYNVFNRRVPLRYLLVSIALKNLNLVYSIARILGLESRFTSTTPAIVPSGNHDPSEHLHPVDLFNHDSVRAAEIPSANGHASARALGKVAALLSNGGCLDGVRLLSSDAVRLAMSDPVERFDEVLRAKTKFTLGGWAVFDTGVGYVREGCVGWFGIGGSAIQWNAELNLGFGYACNLFGASLYNYNSYLVQKAVIQCVKRVKKIA